MKLNELFKPDNKPIKFTWEKKGDWGWDLWYHGPVQQDLKPNQGSAPPRLTTLIEIRFLQGNKNKVYIEADLEGKFSKEEKSKVAVYFFNVVIEGIRQFIGSKPEERPKGETFTQPETIYFSASGKGRNKLYSTMIRHNLIDNYRLDATRDLGPNLNMYILKRTTSDNVEKTD
jgi:hypothetical protein